MLPQSLSLNDLDEADSVFEDEQLSDSDEAGGSVQPYDPRLIRVEPKMFSLRNIMDMIEEDELDLAPDFQRLRVWKPWQKSRLIESVLLRIPLPAFYFASDEEGMLQVVDGVQRLSTIYNFVRGERKDRFQLTKLEYLEKEVGGCYFEDLQGSAWAKRINSTQIVANVIDPQTPMRVKFDIFKRINTGGTPLNAQEIRHCMSGKPSRSLLARLADSEAFHKATNGKLHRHIRMGDKEIILRVLAMHISGLDGYLASESMDDYLNSFTQTLDSASPSFLRTASADFERGMGLAYRIFGENAFRKWPFGSTRVHPINKAVFEALGSILCSVDVNQALSRKAIIVARYRNLCTSDDQFLTSISQSTASAAHVYERHEKLMSLFTVEDDDIDDDI